MPTDYLRDDERRLIIVSITDPYTVEDIIRAVDRQMAENTWEYAMLYDMRATMRLSTTDEAQLIMNRVHSLAGARTRGPVALAISPRSEQVRAGVQFAVSNRGLTVPEVVVTTTQLADWIARNAPGGRGRACDYRWMAGSRQIAFLTAKTL